MSSWTDERIRREVERYTVRTSSGASAVYASIAQSMITEVRDDMQAQLAKLRAENTQKHSRIIQLVAERDRPVYRNADCRPSEKVRDLVNGLVTIALESERCDLHLDELYQYLSDMESDPAEENDKRIAELEAENERLRALLPDGAIQRTLRVAIDETGWAWRTDGEYKARIEAAEQWLDKLESEGVDE